jgi:hypothetical protein
MSDLVLDTAFLWIGENLEVAGKAEAGQKNCERRPCRADDRYFIDHGKSHVKKHIRT